MIVPPIESEKMLTVYAKSDEFARPHSVMVDLAGRTPSKLSSSKPAHLTLLNGQSSPSKPAHLILPNGPLSPTHLQNGQPSPKLAHFSSQNGQLSPTQTAHLQNGPLSPKSTHFNLQNGQLSPKLSHFSHQNGQLPQTPAAPLQNGHSSPTPAKPTQNGHLSPKSTHISLQDGHSSPSRSSLLGLQNGILSPARPAHLQNGQRSHSQPAYIGLQNGYGKYHGHRVIHSTTVGYIAPRFEGKKLQMIEVKQKIMAARWIPDERVDTQIKWFYTELGIDDTYFEIESVDAIAKHITSLYAAKVAAAIREDKRAEVRLDMEASDRALYIDTSEPGVSDTEGPMYERRLEAKYLDSNSDKLFRIESFHSPCNFTGTPTSKATVRCYFVYQCNFKPNSDPQETQLEAISDKVFLAKATKNTKQIYQEVLDLAVSRTGPVIRAFDVEGSQEKRLVVAYRQRTALGILSALTDLCQSHGVIGSRKYVEQFSNGITIISIYLNPAPGLSPNNTLPPIDQYVRQISNEISLLYCIPQNGFQSLFASRRLSLQETIYAHCVWVFVQHFLNRLGSEYASLLSVLHSKISYHAEILSNIKRRLRAETFTADHIKEIIEQYPELISLLYSNFANFHSSPSDDYGDSYIPPIAPPKVLSGPELREHISRVVSNEHDQMVWDAFTVFNYAVLKTNFYTPTKVALSFRLDPHFLPELEYPEPLYGMFFVITSESRGFHLRFRDIARGGIRIVKSRNREAYSINARSIFDENYALANTQQRKNKDIPEGGSKGVILLDANQQDKGRVAFEKYIDSIIDLLLPSASPGVKDPIVDLYGKPEILFMGPDENTADLVDWATEHAHRRGAPWWKSFFTGKSPKLGGIPHDTYGMTTLSVREFIKGIYRKLSLDASTVRKMQTGGPDGDLGSNEILLSNEKYISIIDGAGVLVDPQGINHDELIRLAKKRAMISEFDMSKLSKDGYRVLIDETYVTLPSGEVINNGMNFRNTFHLRNPGSIDAFIPCGGRPESVDLVSVNKLIKDGRSTISYLVEGANLFITQDAKLRLEKAGCILFKDASANKGGVTSSSLEVLASLSFDDEGFRNNMCVSQDGTVPPFYKAYVEEVQEIIKRNAKLEFEAIWREHEETGIPRSTLSDVLSIAITKLDEELQNTDLWHNEVLRRGVLQDALPKLLLKSIGLDLIMTRIPENYLRSIFGSYLASRFVYEFGSSPSQFAFFDFMSKRILSVAPPFGSPGCRLGMATFPFKFEYGRRQRPRTIGVIDQATKQPKLPKGNNWSNMGELMDLDLDIVASQACLDF